VRREPHAAPAPILARDTATRLGQIIRRHHGVYRPHDPSPRLPAPPRPRPGDLAGEPTLIFGESDDPPPF